MARLFITSRELDLISDLTKEVIKDVSGQKIFYYRVREDLSNIHDVYEEATEKVFDPPIELEARIDWGSSITSVSSFGIDKTDKADVFIHHRDLLDKQVTPRVGDFFSFGGSFYEIAQANELTKIFGQVEHPTGYELKGKYARNGLIAKQPIGPTDERFSDDDAVQKVFVQQRGVSENELGPTNDKRDLVEKGILEPPLTGPKKIDDDGIGYSFYGDEDI